MNCLLPAEDYGDQEFSQVMELNIHALHRLTREVGRRWMIPGRYGRILNLSSVKSMIGTTENYAAYCASKGAVNMYTRQLACEWGKYGITCNAIAPTFVRTPIIPFSWMMRLLSADRSFVWMAALRLCSKVFVESRIGSFNKKQKFRQEAEIKPLDKNLTICYSFYRTDKYGLPGGGRFGSKKRLL